MLAQWPAMAVSEIGSEIAAAICVGERGSKYCAAESPIGRPVMLL